MINEAATCCWQTLPNDAQMHRALKQTIVECCYHIRAVGEQVHLQ